MTATVLRSKTIALIVGYAIALQALFSGLPIAARGVQADFAAAGIICTSHGEATIPSELPGPPKPLCPGGLACIMAGCIAVIEPPAAVSQAAPMPVVVQAAIFPSGQASLLPLPRPGASPQSPRGPPSLA
jgi:hypothetical protein